MTFQEYQQFVKQSARYPKGWQYPVLALTEEAGEVSGKFAKALRDKTPLDYVFYSKVAKELGDTLWDLVAIANEIGFSFEDIALRNVEKIQERIKNDTIHGSGDDR